MGFEEEGGGTNNLHFSHYFHFMVRFGIWLSALQYYPSAKTSAFVVKEIFEWSRTLIAYELQGVINLVFQGRGHLRHSK